MKVREKVLELYAQGKTIDEISKELGKSIRSVRYHLQNAGITVDRRKSEKTEIILKLKAEGKTVKEIQEITGYNSHTISNHYYGYNGNKSRNPGWNTDRHLCKTCKYRNKYGKQSIWCFYWPRTGIERRTICEVENCTVYERGTPGKEIKR